MKPTWTVTLLYRNCDTIANLRSTSFIYQILKQKARKMEYVIIDFFKQTYNPSS